MIKTVLTALCFGICCCDLIYASVCDIRTHTVPDFVWWIMAADSLFFLAGTSCRGPVGVLSVFDAVFVIFFQEKIMSRFYGRADSHAFSCSELFFFFMGHGMSGHIIHMTVSFIFLLVIQMIKRNIKRTGDLYLPVPFIPYISVSFIVAILCVQNAT